MTKITADNGITLNIDLAQLLEALGGPDGYDEDGDRTYTSLRSQIVKSATARVIKDLGTTIAEEVRATISAQVKDIVTDALQRGFPKTSVYGEPTGQTTSIAEAIREEVKGYIGGRGAGYDRRDPMQELLRAEVDSALSSTLRKEINAAREEVLTKVRANATAVFTEVIERAVTR